MPLTRNFRVTVPERLQRDPGFREALLEEGVQCLLAGEVDVGKSVLRDYVNATIGFQELVGGPRSRPVDSRPSLCRILSHPQRVPSPAMLNSSAQIRDFGRLLPWAASPSMERTGPDRFSDIVTAEALRRMPQSRRRAVGAAIVRMCKDRENLLTAMVHKMARELRQHSTSDADTLVDDLADPDGEATESCEAAEAHFRAARDDLAGIRRALSASAEPGTDGVEIFAALNRLDDAFRLAVACMQEARWLVLMANGARGAPASKRTFGSGAELIAAIENEAEDSDSPIGTS